MTKSDIIEALAPFDDELDIPNLTRFKYWISKSTGEGRLEAVVDTTMKFCLFCHSPLTRNEGIIYTWKGQGGKVCNKDCQDSMDNVVDYLEIKGRSHELQIL